uniref:Uncharacterized protein n=1 Tax=Mus spicilegus TaxID=10103 RepID=A0A8C6GDH2_MUSSI
MHRLQVVLGHLAGRPESSSALQAAPCSARFPQASASDVVVVHGRRTPIGRASRGGFKDTTPDELLSAVLTAVLQDVRLKPEQLGDISVGNVLEPGAGAVMARIAQFLREGTGRAAPGAFIAGGIRNGSYDIGMACGTMGQMKERAASAQSRGCFRAEIVPVTTTVLDDKGDKKTITVSQDEGVRPSTTMQGLAKLKPAFKDGGSTTAGLTVNDIDIFEINEAFASQAVYCVEKLGIPAEKVNPLGGAIALGHPLGCTGARQVVTLLNELKRRGRRAYGVVSMCIGTGMGAAAVFEYPGN